MEGERVYLRRDTYEDEWEDEYPGMPGRLGICKVKDAWFMRERGDVGRCHSVWKRLARRDEGSL